MPNYGKRVLLVTAVIIGLAAVMSLARRIATVQRLRRDANAFATQAAKASATVAHLQTQIAKATAGTNTEKELRGSGFARPGDQVIRPVPVEVATPTPKAQNARPRSPASSTPPPWKVWWRLFFGG